MSNKNDTGAKRSTSYVCTINAEQEKQLRNYLEERNWKFSAVPYAHWKAVGGDKVNVVAYLSGKLTVQGAGTEDFVLFILEPEILKSFGFGYSSGSEPSDTGTAVPPALAEDLPVTPHGGIDESGKGDFFGPLVIAGVYVDADSAAALKKIGVKDSKAIKSDKQIITIAQGIRKIVPGKFSVVSINPEKYNQLYSKIANLNRLLAWGHARVIENLLECVPDCPRMLSDKFAAEHLIQNALMEKGRNIIMEQQTKAESDVAVAAASILARDGFIRGMEKLESIAQVKLPRGAGSMVELIAREIAKEQGVEVLQRCCKTHFKTYERVIS